MWMEEVKMDSVGEEEEEASASHGTASKRARVNGTSPPKSEDRDLLVVRCTAEVCRCGQERGTMTQIMERHPEADFNRVMDRVNRADDLNGEMVRILTEMEAPQTRIDGQAQETSNGASPSLTSFDLLTDEIQQQAREAGLEPHQMAMLNNCCQIFPDVDPMHVIELLAGQTFDSNDHIADYLVTKGYRKLAPKKAQENNNRRRMLFLNPSSFDVDQFLRIYPEPEKYFVEQGEPSALYKAHALVFLQNHFVEMRVDFFERLLAENGHRLFSTFRAIMDKSDPTPLNGRRRKRAQFGFPQFLPSNRHRSQQISYPENVDETFFREVQFCMNEDKVKRELERRRSERFNQMEMARNAGLLVDCPICLDDEIHPDDLVACDNSINQHTFCSNCVIAHAETRIGEGAAIVTCLNDVCQEGRIPLTVLQPIVSAQNFQILLRRVQQEELRAANLENMESCPFCEFAMIIENENERLFRCLNPTCLKESCRECREESHLPLRCDEVEKDLDVKRRTFIEERMAQAYVRKCPKCGKGIVKSDGCNKMACACGAYFCYVCNKELPKQNPYSHFGTGEGMCRQMSSDGDLHGEVARRAGEEAKREFDAMHGIPPTKEKTVKEINVDQLVEERRPDLYGDYMAMDAMDALMVAVVRAGPEPELSDSASSDDEEEPSEEEEEETDSFIDDEVDEVAMSDEESTASSSSSAMSVVVEDADADNQSVIAVADSSDESSHDEPNEMVLDPELFTDEDEENADREPVAWRQDDEKEDSPFRALPSRKKKSTRVNKKKESSSESEGNSSSPPPQPAKGNRNGSKKRGITRQRRLLVSDDSEEEEEEDERPLRTRHTIERSSGCPVRTKKTSKEERFNRAAVGLDLYTDGDTSNNEEDEEEEEDQARRKKRR